MKKLLDINKTSDGLFEWLKEKELLIIEKSEGNILKLNIKNIGQKNITHRKITYKKHEKDEYWNTVSIEGNKNGMTFSFTFNLTDVRDYYINEDECCLTLNDNRNIFIKY